MVNAKTTNYNNCDILSETVVFTQSLRFVFDRLLVFICIYKHTYAYNMIYSETCLTGYLYRFVQRTSILHGQWDPGKKLGYIPL